MSTENLVDKNMECIICLDLIDIEKQNIEIFKDCEHNNNYHEECINNWVSECIDKNIKPSCPVCRKELDIININNQDRIIIHNLSSNDQNRIHIIQTNSSVSLNNFCCVCSLSIFFSIIIFY